MSRVGVRSAAIALVVVAFQRAVECRRRVASGLCRPPLGGGALRRPRRSRVLLRRRSLAAKERVAPVAAFD